MWLMKRDSQSAPFFFINVSGRSLIFRFFPIFAANKKEQK